jgi:hypothetical protein
VIVLAIISIPQKSSSLVKTTEAVEEMCNVLNDKIRALILDKNFLSSQKAAAVASSKTGYYAAMCNSPSHSFRDLALVFCQGMKLFTNA